RNQGQGTDRQLVSHASDFGTQLRGDAMQERGGNVTTVQVFDKPLCCSGGICGPDVDPALVSFAANLQWLQRQGVQVQRINPAHQPELFAGSALIRDELQKHGNDCLPVVVVNDTVVSRGVFPGRDELAKWTGTTIE